MAVTILQNPGAYNLAHGPNAVTLSNLASADKYVLQLWDPAGPTKFADIRQNANIAGVAQFDIQHLIEAYTKPSPIDIEKTDKWADSASEIFIYEIKYGSETGGVATIDGSVSGLIALNGRKAYYEVDWNEGPYQSQVSTDGESPCTIVDIQGKALTDWSYYVSASSISDGKPTMDPSDKVYVQSVRRSDNFTLSYLQHFVYGSSAPLNANGIESLRIVSYDAAGVKLDDFLITNTIANGGGPNVNIGDGTAVTDPFYVVTAGVGPANTEMLTNLNANTHHYYVLTPALNAEFCAGDWDFLTDRSAFAVYRFNIIEENCFDYPPIQFSWMNSLGFRDYFQFQKRAERSVQIERNNFLKEANDYSTLQYNVQPGDRGYTTYSQKLEEQWTANTRFLQDYEASFIENLFISPDVRVRFDGSTTWFPVTLLSTSYTERSYRKDRLFQYEIQFKIAHNKTSQRG